MSEETGNPGQSSLLDRLFGEGPRFDFFQAVRCLERCARAQTPDAPADGADAQADAQKVVATGHEGPSENEPVRFRAVASLGFPASAIESIAPFVDARPPPRTEMRKPPEMHVTFMSLAGAVGVLPDHYTSTLIERLRAKDMGMRDFLDLFNHRLVSLFYRAWEKYRFEAAYERWKIEQHSAAPDKEEPLIPDAGSEVPRRTGSTVEESGSSEYLRTGVDSRRADGKTVSKPQAAWEDIDAFTSALMSLTGMGTRGLSGRLSFADETVALYAGHFSHYPRNTASLELLLSDFLEMPTAIRKFVGQWLPLAEEERSSVSRKKGARSFCALGASSVIGRRVWDVQSKFRVRIGPLSYQQYCELIPQSLGLRRVFDLARLYVGREFDFDVQPVLKAAEIPKGRVARDRGHHDRVANRLGRNFWLKSKTPHRDFDSAIFKVENA